MQVHRVFAKGAASLEGTIQRGDSVLSINGTSLEGKTHGEAVSCLHQARPSNQAIVVIWRDKDSELCLSVSDRHDSASQSKRMCSAKTKSFEAGAGKALAYISDNIDIPASLHEGKQGLHSNRASLCLTILTLTLPVLTC